MRWHGRVGKKQSPVWLLREAPQRGGKETSRHPIGSTFFFACAFSVAWCAGRMTGPRRLEKGAQRPSGWHGSGWRRKDAQSDENCRRVRKWYGTSPPRS